MAATVCGGKKEPGAYDSARQQQDGISQRQPANELGVCGKCGEYLIWFRRLRQGRKARTLTTEDTEEHRGFLRLERSERSLELPGFQKMTRHPEKPPCSSVPSVVNIRVLAE